MDWIRPFSNKDEPEGLGRRIEGRNPRNPELYLAITSYTFSKYRLGVYESVHPATLLSAYVD